MPFSHFFKATAFAVVLLLGRRAYAEPMPDPVMQIVTEAVKSGNAATIQATVEVAKKAYPKSAKEIDKLVADLKAQAEAERIALARRQRFSEGWKGEGELGASRTTGNTDTTDVAIGLHLTKDGFQWKHMFNATADYQHTQGVAGEDKYLAGYEVNYKFDPRIFADGLVQWERDRFAGFYSRETESLGVGYSALHTPKLTLDLTAGPAVREIDQVLGQSKIDVEARFASQVTWNISPTTVFTENLNIYAGGGENTYESTTALTTKIINALAARASFDVKKETNPGPAFKKTDTISRVTLVYGF